MTNQFGWPLPLTDKMLEDESPYAAFQDPAQNIAERLIMLGHLGFNASIWSSRADRYWPGFRERAEAATNNPDVASWWQGFMDEIIGQPLRSPMLLHEKNLLCHPATLPGTQVEDQDVLLILRQYSLDLTDRCRIWAKTRRDLKASERVENDYEEGDGQ